ncbi:MAG: tetratricopeptide repeat protein [Rhizobiaceae bacterium]
MIKLIGSMLVAAILVLPGTALAQTNDTSKVGETAAQLSTLDQLFFDLKRERNEKAAERIAQKIWAEWFKSGSASIDLMMTWSQDAVKERKFGVALDFLDQVVTLQPDFAEGWNRRATLHFMMKDYSKSIADIKRTLALEPRHFGALSGWGMILKDTDQKEQALKVFTQALEVYPMMRSAQTQVAELSDELAGDDI